MRLGIFAGRVGGDAELRTSKSGKPVLNWSLAVDVKDGGGKSTLWVDCSMWGDRATALAQYLQKGASVTVHGDVSVRAYESSGEPRAQLQCNVYGLTFGGSSKREEGSQASPARNETDDEIPF